MGNIFLRRCFGYRCPSPYCSGGGKKEIITAHARIWTRLAIQCVWMRCCARLCTTTEGRACGWGYLLFLCMCVSVQLDLDIGERERLGGGKRDTVPERIPTQIIPVL